ncbi:MAG TPA: c-type cytochrome biogenesis protein CcsB [Candidatus Limnocylindrales bacterium]|nr:c-type cytochrome biogenesis protein CcsB [Candidatus Limnocylindrales bacterium]
MEKMSYYSFVAAAIAIALALVLYVAYAVSGLRAARMQTAGMAGMRGGAIGLVVGPRTATFGRYGSILGWLAFVFLSAWLVFRTLATGHGPFANMYEFSVAFAWGILGAYYWFERSYHQRILGLIALPIALAMMLYAAMIPAQIDPLVPALQNNLLLTVHVAVAIVAYGSFSIAFGAAVLYLFQQRPVERAFALGFVAALVGLVIGAVQSGLITGLAYGVVAGGIFGGIVFLLDGRRGLDVASATGGSWGLPKPAVLDEIGYKAVVVGFPFLAATIILGAIWADVAWGSYWSWDPKETASLVTWLLYAAYLHARVVRGWIGTRAAILLQIGFGATLLTYFGNYFFGGLHSYAGLG